MDANFLKTQKPPVAFRRTDKRTLVRSTLPIVNPNLTSPFSGDGIIFNVSCRIAQLAEARLLLKFKGFETSMESIYLRKNFLITEQTK